MTASLHLLERLYEEERVHLTDWRFWTVQGLVIGLAGIHSLIEGVYRIHAHGLLYFVPEALFLIPVGYAALNFGHRGSILTAAWATLLSLPNIWVWHRGQQIEGTVLQLLIVNAVAVFVGQRVDREMRARRQIEETKAALAVSERRFRTLFESAGEAVLVFDRAGAIHQANLAAGELLQRPAFQLEGAQLQDLVGTSAAMDLLNGGEHVQSELVIDRSGLGLVYLEPVRTVYGEGDQTLVQVVLRDVTQHRHLREAMRTFANHVLRAQEEERRRIAQELHDDILQSLILMLRRLDAAEEGAGLPPRAEGEIHRARSIGEVLMANVRDFTGQLRPPALEALGLVSSVQRMLDEMAAHTSVRTTLSVAGQVRRLDQDVELVLFRIVQEALRNVERHARAGSVDVRVTFLDDGVTLAVADDGRGFDVQAIGYGSPEMRHFGLLGMQERAHLLGGRLTVLSQEGAGTTVTIQVPA